VDELMELTLTVPGWFRNLPADEREAIATVKKVQVTAWTFPSICALPANSQFYRVDPRGLEPLTSAMRRRRKGFAVVLECSENRLFKPDSHTPRLLLFVAICPGNCQVTVKKPRLDRRALFHC
jgi:hypothetical protein